ncbi:unnamed protein product [Gadus morhua 'NCC']
MVPVTCPQLESAEFLLEPLGFDEEQLPEEGLCREVVALPGRTPQDLSVLQGADPVIGPLRKRFFFLSNQPVDPDPAHPSPTSFHSIPALPAQAP